MSTLLDRVEYVQVDPDATRRPLIDRVRARAILSTALKLAIGIVLCAKPWTAVLVVGWTFRAMRRRILQGWWRQSPNRDEIDFDAWVAPIGNGVPGRPLPRWIASERLTDRLRQPMPDGRSPSQARTIARLPAALLGSFASNLGTGLKAIACTYALTLPACALWLGSWYDGWNTSFTKGYENAFVGAQTGIFAHLLFIAAMLYVPMAWAHLASSGRARDFFQFGLVGRLIWRSGATMALYAAAFAAATLPVLVLRAAPAFFVVDDPAAWIDADPAEVRRLAASYQLAAGIYLFAAFVLLHLLAANIYRSALLRALSDDPRLADRLPAPIRSALMDLRLIPAESPRRGPLIRATRWSARTASNLAAGLAAALLWFVVIAQIYVSQFFNYIPWAGWLNQPLIHLPCLQTTPAGLG